MGDFMMAMMKKLSMMLVLAMCLLAGFVQTAEVSAQAHINFNAAGVYLRDGKTVVEGYLVNSGDTGATVSSAKISVLVRDSANNPFWEDSGLFSNVGVYVPAGGSVGHTFNIFNDQCRYYGGVTRWSVHTDLWY